MGAIPCSAPLQRLLSSAGMWDVAVLANIDIDDLSGVLGLDACTPNDVCMIRELDSVLDQATEIEWI